MICQWVKINTKSYWLAGKRGQWVRLWDLAEVINTGVLHERAILLAVYTVRHRAKISYCTDGPLLSVNAGRHSGTWPGSLRTHWDTHTSTHIIYDAHIRITVPRQALHESEERGNQPAAATGVCLWHRDESSFRNIKKGEVRQFYPNNITSHKSKRTVLHFMSFCSGELTRFRVFPSWLLYTQRN